MLFWNKSKAVKNFAAALASCALVLSFSSCYVVDPNASYDTQSDDNSQVSSQAVRSKWELDGPFELHRVVDGDTVRVYIDGESTSVRLIGIDTPESVHPQKEKNVPEGTIASDYTKSLLENCDEVYLEYDEQKYDRYGRLLAYVYIDRTTMLNEILVEDGYAKVYMIKPNLKYKEYFEELEKFAKEEGLGLWPTGVFDSDTSSKNTSSKSTSSKKKK